MAAGQSALYMYITMLEGYWFTGPKHCTIVPWLILHVTLSLVFEILVMVKLSLKRFWDLKHKFALVIISHTVS